MPRRKDTKLANSKQGWNDKTFPGCRLEQKLQNTELLILWTIKLWIWQLKTLDCGDFVNNLKGIPKVDEKLFLTHFQAQNLYRTSRIDLEKVFYFQLINKKQWAGERVIDHKISEKYEKRIHVDCYASHWPTLICSKKCKEVSRPTHTPIIYVIHA